MSNTLTGNWRIGQKIIPHLFSPDETLFVIEVEVDVEFRDCYSYVSRTFKKWVIATPLDIIRLAGMGIYINQKE